MIDSFKYKGLRAKMVEEIAGKGIQNQSILEAMATVPRHFFVQSAFADMAYEDKALPIAEEQTISQPFTVAYQLTLLGEVKGLKVLEIGTGSGYQAALLCAMGAQVHSVEIHRKLYQHAKNVLSELDYGANLLCGDGSLGWAKYAPYDKIIVAAACPNVVEALQQQLKIGGKLVLPVGNLQVQQMCLITRVSAQEFQISRYDKFRFVPLTGQAGWKK